MSPIQINQVSSSRLASIDFNTLSFGNIFSDHMFVADYTDGKWCNLQIVPYSELLFSPATAVLHYGQAIFEGIKAYRHPNGQIAIFRPFKNLERLNNSAKRMCMPEIPVELFTQGLTQLIDLDRQWVPSATNQSLYIRPLMFATDTVLGVHASENYKFIILTGPVETYYSKPLKVKIELNYSRAEEGGVGYAKTAGNYARSLYPTKLAQAEGFDQIIWTDSPKHRHIEESGTANVMFVINNTLITPCTSKNKILNGITRDTILNLANSWGYTVEERKVSVKEVVQAAKSGMLEEAFATGTAATIAPIAAIGHQSDLYTLPNPASGVFAKKALHELNAIRYGLAPDPYGWNFLI